MSGNYWDGYWSDTRGANVDSGYRWSGASSCRPRLAGSGFDFDALRAAGDRERAHARAAGQSGDVALWRRCVHEAGHETYGKYRGIVTEGITIDETGGRTVFDPDASMLNYHNTLGFHAAGQVAVRLAGLPAYPTPDDDAVIAALEARMGVSAATAAVDDAEDVLRQHGAEVVQRASGLYDAARGGKAKIPGPGKAVVTHIFGDDMSYCTTCHTGPQKGPRSAGRDRGAEARARHAHLYGQTVTRDYAWMPL